MPTIEKLHKTYKDKGLVVLGVNDEEPEVVRGFYKKNDVTFPTATDKPGAVSEHYGITAVPTTIIYDRKGKIVAQLVGTRKEQQFLRLLRKAGLR